MKKNIIYIVLLVCSLNINAQQVTDFMPSSNSLLEYIIVNDTDNGLDGSVFYEDKYVKGTIIEEGRKNFRAYLRYNALKDHVEVKVSPLDSDVYVLARNDKFSYKLNSYTYILTNSATADGKKLDSYLLEYFSGNRISFLGKPNLKIVEDRKEKSAFVEFEPPRMEINIDYYIKEKDKPLVKVKLREKDFKNIIGSSKEMKQYFDDHKINEIPDVVEMLKFYDTLNN